LSTNGGVSRFEPDSGAIRNFRQSQGLQGNEFNFGAHFRSVTGELFFGGPNGYNAFFPERLLYDEIPPASGADGVPEAQSARPDSGRPRASYKLSPWATRTRW